MRSIPTDSGDPLSKDDLIDVIERLKDEIAPRKPSFVGKTIRVYQDAIHSIGPGVQGEVECLDAVATPFSYLICVRNIMGHPVWFDSRRAAGLEVVGEPHYPAR